MSDFGDFGTIGRSAFHGAKVIRQKLNSPEGKNLVDGVIYGAASPYLPQSFKDGARSIGAPLIYD